MSEICHFTTCRNRSSGGKEEEEEEEGLETLTLSIHSSPEMVLDSIILTSHGLILILFTGMLD